MTNKYVLIESAYEGDAARFAHMLNYNSRFKLRKGIPLTATFPQEATYRMRDDFPDNIALHELLYNLDSQLVVNEKVRAFLEAQGVQHIEYLPVRVLNHKDRQVKERYFVLNLLPLVDCIDRSKTQCEESSLDPDQLMNISNLTVHEEKIPPDFQLLRLKGVSDAVLIRRELAEKMKAAGFRGFRTSEISEYSGG